MIVSPADLKTAQYPEYLWINPGFIANLQENQENDCWKTKNEFEYFDVCEDKLYQAREMKAIFKSPDSMLNIHDHCISW